MEKPMREPIGNLKISHEVIATIASFAAREIDGVASMAAAPGNIKRFIRHATTEKSIRIELTDDVAAIDVYVNLRYGAKIPVVSEQIQRSVKDAVQNMTGIVVAKVNVFVVGIDFEEAAQA
ncbi:MAG: Asp23/Gls24 family envelope stress response protein [Oscillospiraceae bacterium]|nr:Asp23/Gls24 family envelope stress response protein [Oscillospiraceae bacterium]